METIALHTKNNKNTDADFRKIGEGHNCQLINGKIIMTPSSSAKHQYISWTIVMQLGQHLQKTNAGRAFYAPMDVFLNEESAYQPDILLF